MAKSPFYPFRNAKLTFMVEDSGSDITDSAGNPTPAQKKITLFAFLEPKKTSRDRNIPNGQGVGVTESILEGYLVSPTKMPKGVKPLDKTIEAEYMKQPGEFTMLIDLPDPVGADVITGDKISGTFRLIGGI